MTEQTGPPEERRKRRGRPTLDPNGGEAAQQSTRLPHALYDDVCRIASARRMTVAQFCRDAIEREVTRYKHGMRPPVVSRRGRL